MDWTDAANQKPIKNTRALHFLSARHTPNRLDTSTPAGKMVFTVPGAVAKLERSLIVERVKAGLRNAKAKGKRLGRPQMVLDIARINNLRAKRLSWPLIAEQLGVGVGTVDRAHQGLAKIRE